MTGNVFLAKGGGQTATWTNDNTYTGGTLIMSATNIQETNPGNGGGPIP